MARPKQNTIDFIILIGEVFLDALVIYLAFCVSFWIRFHSGIFLALKGVPEFSTYQSIFPVATVVILLVFKSMGLYIRKGLGLSISSLQVMKAVTWSMFVLMSITFIYRDVSYSRLLLVINGCLNVVSILLLRSFLEKFEIILYKNLKISKNVLMIGKGKLADKIVINLRKTTGDLYHVVGVLDEESQFAADSTILKNSPVLGRISNLEAVLIRNQIDEVILTIPGLEQNKIIEIILTCEKEMVHFRMVPDIYEILTSQVEVENFYGITLLGLKLIPLEKALNRFLKRSFDLIGAGLGILACIPVFCIIAILIKRDSKGKVFYGQERVGEDGKQFVMYKFRTMIENAEEDTGPVWAKVDDSRRTRLGKILRRYNLDELPQLWNVLKADMSLVGPRPERPFFVDEFKDRIPRYMSRHKIKSGMTGWAQVNGLRGNTPVEERIKYDLFYLENWSILFDVFIIVKTFLTQKNAY